MRVAQRLQVRKGRERPVSVFEQVVQVLVGGSIGWAGVGGFEVVVVVVGRSLGFFCTV